MNDYYPAGTFELPGEKEELKTYVFTIFGEIEVEGYSEEDAEDVLENNLREILADAYYNGDIEID